MQVKTDLEKTKAMDEWPVPTTQKQLQHFLGFVSFYRRALHNFTQTDTPLTKLISPKVPISQSTEIDIAFRQFKERFTPAPILV